jgi:hypothetical protein
MNDNVVETVGTETVDNSAELELLVNQVDLERKDLVAKRERLDCRA